MAFAVDVGIFMLVDCAELVCEAKSAGQERNCCDPREIEEGPPKKLIGGICCSILFELHDCLFRSLLPLLEACKGRQCLSKFMQRWHSK
jgi:hypothetical protein